MRRLVLPVIAAFGLVMIGSSSAFADDPSPVVSPPSTPGKKVCKIADKDLDEVSGIVATKTGFIVINDGSNDPAKEKVFLLDSKCKVTDEVSYSGKGPSDTEDLILSADGKTLWIADTGDNDHDNEGGAATTSRCGRCRPTARRNPSSTASRIRRVTTTTPRRCCSTGTAPR